MKIKKLTINGGNVLLGGNNTMYVYGNERVVHVATRESVRETQTLVQQEVKREERIVKNEEAETEFAEVVETETEKRVRFAIETLRREKKLPNAYDYAWILLALNDQEDLKLHFSSSKKFLKYLRENVHVDNLPSEDSLNKVLAGGVKRASEIGIGVKNDPHESIRRRQIQQRFLSAFRKGK